MTLRIGLDLDNTIINYDRAFLLAARERGLVDPGFTGSKQQVRDHIRAASKDGETEWQKLQGYVYGKGILQAELFDGVAAFLERAHQAGARMHIVSHKTQFGHYDPDKIDLREAALRFLEQNGVLIHIPREEVFFFTTRDEKIAKIKALGCDVFVDDLEEVLGDPAFPAATRKILFSSLSKVHGASTCSDWADIARCVFEENPTFIASSLLGFKADRVTLAGGGGNSRIYRVEAKGKHYALKMYPPAGNDKRDRLGVEKQTLQFFERNGIAQAPRWLGDKPGYGLLSWVEGTLANPPLPGEIDQAADFIETIHRLSALPEAKSFPPASEACTSGEEILRQIVRRFARLEEAAAIEPLLREFLNDRFNPALTHLEAQARAAYALDSVLDEGKCLIPADFGFHNAIRGSDGRLTFIDFEYFGWDDPVKLIADFLLHPAMRLEPADSARLRERACTIFGGDPGFALRLRALKPLFALRWTLILLNEFLPERWSGRAFARGENEWAAAKERQLAKATQMLARASLEE